MYIIRYWKSFYQYSGKNLILILFLSPLIGLLDGLGLTIIIPFFTSELGTDKLDNDHLLQKIKMIVQSFGTEPSFINILILISIIILIKNVVKYFHLHLSSIIISSFIKNVRFKILQLLEGMDYSYYIKIKTGHLLNTATSDVFKYSTTQKVFIGTISSFFVLAGYLLVLFINSWRLSISLIIIGFLISKLYKTLNSKAKDYSRKVVTQNKDFNAKLIEAVNYYKYLKATAKFPFFGKKLEKNINKFSEYQLKTTVINDLPSILQEPITMVIIFLLFIINKWFFFEPNSSLITILAISYRASGTINQFQSQIQQFYSGIGSMEAVGKLISELNNHQEISRNLNDDLNFENEITLKNVSFSYEDKEVLKNISLTIPKYSTIAIVGPSGAGKSTLIDILCGLLKPDSGYFIIDNNVIQDLSSNMWRKRIGYITQENIVFDGTVTENICLDKSASHSYPNENLNNALLWSNAMEFVNDLPDKLDSTLGERGIRLSGGQRQRISIARELFKQPEILIMDEATSSLDSESEMNIQKHTDELKGKFTMIIIAHRLSTVKNADIIFVIKNGKLIESGSFKELSESTSSFFYKLIKDQKLIQ